MRVGERTWRELGFAEVLEALAKRCQCELGRARALSRPFLHAPDEIDRSLRAVEEARGLRRSEVVLPLWRAADISQPVLRAEKGGLIEPRELLSIAGCLLAFSETKQLLAGRAEDAPSLYALGAQLPSLASLAHRIESTFEPSGEISDSASPALKEARDRTRGLHRHIKTRLETLLRDEKFTPHLRESYISVRNDRYVVPILAASRSQVPGIVHNASQTGQTLFIEPEALIGLGNELAIAQSLVSEEERRVLQALSDAVGEAAARILPGQGAAAQLDELQAAGHLADDLDASVPEAQDAQAGLLLRQLRHPLLALSGRPVVPNDVALEGGQRGLVISGPNAGGKTVTLSAVGLCALLFRAGLPIPAGSGSRLALYGAVHSAIGDAQDLAQGLSTFSAHVTRLKEIHAAAQPDALVLIDEIAADTDPREGAALAVAVLEALIVRGATVVVTTHLQELKALALTDARFVNARVALDPKTLAPTYRLQLGASGSSSAIEVARRVGLPEDICQRARTLWVGEGGPLTEALALAQEDRQRAGEELAKAQLATRQAEQLRAQLTQEREHLAQERREGALKLREEAHRVLSQAQRAADDALSTLRSAASLAEAERAAKAVADEASRAAEAAALAREENARATAPSGPVELKPGGWVRHVGLGQDVEILELHGDEALVAAGPMKVRVPIEKLVATAARRPKPRFPGGPAERGKGSLERARAAQGGDLVETSDTLDVRGLRADDALREVEKFLDAGFRRGATGATIIHGHGTGALKQVVRELLDKTPYIRLYRPGSGSEGGDGVTVVGF